ncbi:MAG TPA: phosphoglucosamine mutase [Mycobacteriales bacterium]|nr:phosphoglucosamine mutase [Mycobacteriales bacterium]
MASGGARLFGTDGVRGRANADLTPELALALGQAAVRVLCERGRRALVVVGRDPRASGELLEGAVVAGLASAGADVVRVGVLPTPAIASLTVVLGADLGVMLSASHNPMPDNGVKIFDRLGGKLPDSVEDDIQAAITTAWERPTGADVGRVRDLDARVGYVDRLVATVGHRLDGIRVVVDCAHGAAYDVAPEALRRAGADVVVINAEPDGLNINEGVGSTHLDGLVAAVLAHRADVGIAHDGDADRCLAVDADGGVVDGDAILAICAVALHESGRLAHDTVVTTVMTNLGFRRAMAAQGITCVETAVGDRYVLEAMREGGFSLGGEQSGHLVFGDLSPTGDGALTALQLLSRMAGTGRPLRELAAVMERLPQVLVNVPVRDRSAVAEQRDVAEVIAEVTAELGDTGRLLVRPSGTEQLVRVMVEAATAADAARAADAVAEVVRRTMGDPAPHH